MTYFWTLFLTCWLFVVGAFALAFCAKAEPVYVDRCSGIYIGKNYVLTAGHCVEGQTSTFVKRDQEDDQAWVAQVIWTDHRRDFALLQTEVNLDIKATKVSCEYPKMGQHFKLKGWPAGEYAETLSYIAGEKKKRFVWPVSYFVAGPGFYGHSGSGLYNQITDTVDLILVGGLIGSGLMIAIPIAEICPFIPSEIR